MTPHRKIKQKCVSCAEVLDNDAEKYDLKNNGCHKWKW